MDIRTWRVVPSNGKFFLDSHLEKNLLKAIQKTVLVSTERIDIRGDTNITVLLGPCGV